jgi:hypothetical protein
MRAWRLAPVIFAAACAGDYIPVADFASKDFSVADAPVLEDFSPPGGGDGGDLAVGQDLGGHDLAVADLLMPDLQMPDLLMPDLTPAPMCDLMPPDVDGGVHGLRLAGAAAAGAFATATFDGASWSGFLTDGAHAYSDVALGSVAIARQTDSSLDHVRIDPCSNVPSGQQIGALQNSFRPSIAGGDVIFRGKNDTNLYHTHWDGSTWSAVSVQSSLTSNFEPLALFESGALHVMFTGINKTVYDGTISDAAGGGAAIPAGGGTSDQPPAAAVASSGTVFMAFKGVTDNSVFFSMLPSGGSWSAPAKICPVGTCLATTNSAPTLAVGASGAPVLLFVGTDSHVYSSSYGSAWSNPIAASSGTDTTTYRPALATGIGAAEAELAYVRASDGAPVHGRLISGTWSFAAVSGAAFQSAPALASW